MRPRNLGPLLVSAALCCACATVDLPPGYLAELDAREAPNARFSVPATLLEDIPARIVGTMARDGRAHLWAIDKGRTLHHAEVDEHGVVTRERVGAVRGDLHTLAFDAIEERTGALRVLAGSSQFIRNAVGSPWQEVTDNPCHRFVAAAGRLLCGFVTSGEQLGAPKRTDWYAGVVLIVPFAIPVERQSRKLVVAERFGDSWVVRAVVDVANPLDAEARFLMVADDQGNIQIVFAASRGGALILVTGGGLGGAGPEPALRYARLASESLARSAAGGPTVAPEGVVSVVSRPMTTSPWREHPGAMDWQVLTEMFAVDPSTGVIEGLMPWLRNAKVRFRGADAQLDGVFDAVLHDGTWQAPTDFVLVNDWPTRDFNYTFMGRFGPGAPSVSFDRSGRFHALAPHCTDSPMWHPCGTALSYLVKRDGHWSRPLAFPVPLDREHQERRALLLVGAGRVFAAWAQASQGLRGAWIMPLDATDVRPAASPQR